jgi:hypothetical protein
MHVCRTAGRQCSGGCGCKQAHSGNLPDFRNSKSVFWGRECGSGRKEVGALISFLTVPACGAVEAGTESAAKADTSLDGSCGRDRKLMVLISEIVWAMSPSPLAPPR